MRVRLCAIFVVACVLDSPWEILGVGRSLLLEAPYQLTWPAWVGVNLDGGVGWQLVEGLDLDFHAHPASSSQVAGKQYGEREHQ